jgi:hypothetical protein
MMINSLLLIQVSQNLAKNPKDKLLNLHFKGIYKFSKILKSNNNLNKAFNQGCSMLKKY